MPDDVDMQRRIPAPSPLEIDGAVLAQALGAVGEGVDVLDRRRRIRWRSPAAERITGWPAGEVVGRSCAHGLLQHVDSEGRPLCLADRCPAAQSIRDLGQHEAVVWLRHRDGHRLAVLTRVTPLFDRAGEVIGAVEAFRPVEASAGREQELGAYRELALIDELTELPNRRLLLSRVAERLEERRRLGLGFAVLFLDVDHFKQVNDGLGHAAGDAVLRTVGRSLRAGVRSVDLVGRYGGDEFLIVCGPIGHREAVRMADRCRALVAGSRTPVPGGGEHRITISVGVVRAEDADEVDGLITRADRAMYLAKAAGGDRVGEPPPPAG